MAALAFGASGDVHEVSIQLDSLGLEEVVEERDSAIKQLMSTMIQNFQATLKTAGFSGDVKGAAKDGDVHGNPVPISNHQSTDFSPLKAAPSEGAEGSDATDDAAHPAQGNPATDGQEGDEETSADDKAFEEVMQGVDLGAGLGEDFDNLDNANSSAQDAEHGDTGSAEHFSVPVKQPTMRHLVTVTFRRDEFMSMIRSFGFDAPSRFYEQFGARMRLENGDLKPIEAHLDLRDAQFAPPVAQEDPELLSIDFDSDAAEALGAKDALGISIQREDLLQRVVEKTEELAAGDADSAQSAHGLMELFGRIGDPEVMQHTSEFTSAVINHTAVPTDLFVLSKNLDATRMQAHEELFSGNPTQAIETVEEALEQLDDLYENNPGIPRYFNSYAERVVYNKLFATPGERTVLIPDNLFYAHMEVADLLAQVSGPDAAIGHLTKLVHYAPAYPLAHLKLASQFAKKEDWESARAAVLNALRVALDRDDAAFAYYRFAYYSWMRDEFDVAVAAYIVSDAIRHNAIPSLEPEFNELMARVNSQRIPVPRTLEDSRAVLAFHGIVVWPQTQTAEIVEHAARVAVDLGLFVPARTLCLAAARLDDSSENGLDIIQGQFLRSLNA
jgi:tetratricopeptide (TPR) repeat protein